MQKRKNTARSVDLRSVAGIVLRAIVSLKIRPSGNGVPSDTAELLDNSYTTCDCKLGSASRQDSVGRGYRCCDSTRYRKSSEDNKHTGSD